MSEFRGLNETCEQYARQLGNVPNGTRLPQGVVRRSLGAGTFGTVLQVDSENGSVQCLKLYHANDLHESGKVARFRRGYEAMKQLDHPHIVKVHEYSAVPLGFFMDFIDGPNARSYAPGITDDPQQIIRLLLQVGETLQHAHVRGVIHRDVKPENILIRIADSGDAQAFLTDFDLAWFSTATKLTKLADGFGSHFYAAPEQMSKPNSPAARTESVDVFSFGQLCFFFLAGRDPTPLDPGSNVKALRDALGRHWTDPDQAEALVNFYESTVQIDPRRRPKNFRDVCQLLADVELELTTDKSVFDTQFFLGSLRLTLTGEFGGKAKGAVSMKSMSGSTDLTASVTADGLAKISLDVALRPYALVLQGLTSQEARQTMNQRIDECLRPYGSFNAIRRSGGKGSYEVIVKLDGLSKSKDGVVKAREIISRVVDVLEHT